MYFLVNGLINEAFKVKTRPVFLDSHKNEQTLNTHIIYSPRTETEMISCLFLISYTLKKFRDIDVRMKF